MYILYTTNRSEAQDVQVLSRFPDDTTATLKRQAVRMMRHRQNEAHSIQHLLDTPYDLCMAENGFGDRFKVLHWVASPRDYAETEKLMDTYNYLERDAFPDICEAFQTIGHPLRFIVMDVDLSEEEEVVAQPVLRITSEIVEAALQDARTLIDRSGAPNAVDRAHTAFHAYLRQICQDDLPAVTVSDDADITMLFKLLRQHHPKLQGQDPQADKMMVDIMRGFARVIDALNPVRNQNSLAHPNQLLDRAEATLAINAIWSMLHYLDMKLK